MSHSDSTRNCSGLLPYQRQAQKFDIRLRLRRQPQPRPTSFYGHRFPQSYKPHRLPPGGNGERAEALTLTWVSGYAPASHWGETTHHLFARSRTLRIKLTFGFSISTVFSISPLPAVLNYDLELSDFHRISRAEGPTQLTWMPVNRPATMECQGEKPTCGDQPLNINVSMMCGAKVLNEKSVSVRTHRMSSNATHNDLASRAKSWVSLSRNGARRPS